MAVVVMTIDTSRGPWGPYAARARVQARHTGVNVDATLPTVRCSLEGHCGMWRRYYGTGRMGRDLTGRMAPLYRPFDLQLRTCSLIGDGDTWVGAVVRTLAWQSFHGGATTLPMGCLEWEDALEKELAYHCEGLSRQCR